ncbi:hypothetical protein BX616_004234 [Lobosporangium transversale]|nr:hypothetical protein BX616_004234 [Lobosporangium transversale]
MVPINPIIPPRSLHLPRAIDNDSLILQGVLGIGAYGSVHRAIDIRSGLMRAVKCLSKRNPEMHHTKKYQEVELHAKVSGHPNIATLYGVIQDEDLLYMVLDCGNEGDLFNAITERGGFFGEDARIKSIFCQIAQAVVYCHSKGVFHRDLKPENIVMFGNSVKLVDFGLATSERISSDFGCGSTFYLSPECQGGFNKAVEFYDSAANDVWSLGVILINLVFGRNPWKQACAKDETFMSFVLNPDILQTILPMTDEMNEIIKAVFHLDPAKRIKLPELIARVQACKSFSTMTSTGMSTGTGTGATVVTGHGTVPAVACANASVLATPTTPPIGSCGDVEQSQDSGIGLHT